MLHFNLFVPKGDCGSPSLAYTSGKVYHGAPGEEEEASRAVLGNEIGYVEEITAVIQGRRGKEASAKLVYHVYVQKVQVILVLKIHVTFEQGKVLKYQC